jgi:type II secretory pathway pseudopilin PulG
MIRQGALKDERGLTLVELAILMIIMGMIFAIAIPAFISGVGLVENRKVDSATNQVAAHLRHANNQATNRLADSDFTTPDPTPPVEDPPVVPLSTYEIGPAGAVASDRLPKGTQIATATNIKFMADGSVQVVSGPPAVDGTITITVRSSNDAANNHTIQINTTTSRIKVVP